MAYHSSNRKTGLHKIVARFNCTCKETGKRIAKGEEMYYNYDFKTCYCMSSPLAAEYEKLGALQAHSGQDQGGDMLDAMLEQASDNWASANL